MLINKVFSFFFVSVYIYILVKISLATFTSILDISMQMHLTTLLRDCTTGAINCCLNITKFNGK